MQCPQPQILQQLLDETLPADQQPTIQAHLETCGGCQQTIERLAAGGVTWDRTAQSLGDKPAPQETALIDAVEKLQSEPTSADLTREVPARPIDDDLSFLQPTTKPNSLGRLDEFEILSVVGKGGFGIVLKAFDENLHRIVALKVMLPQMAASGTARQRFIKEAQAAAAITHENVVTIHKVEKNAKHPYLAMQFVSGQTLNEKIDRAGQLSLKEILRIGTQMAEGLAAAHKQGVVHRDIKPANVLLENGVERVKITDFGLARVGDDASLTQSGTVAGTPMYMSPEQANGETVDQRSDLFSLGSVLYVMCTGRAPFRANTTMAVMKRVCEDTPKAIRTVNADIPAWLEAIVTKLHAKKPGDRYQTATEVADVLGEHLAELQAGRAGSVSDRSPATQTMTALVPAAPTPVARSPGSPRRRRRVVAAALVLLLVAVAPVVLIATGTFDRFFEASHVGPDPNGPEPPKKDGVNPPAVDASDKNAPATLAKTYKNKLGMEFVLVPKGRSWLGGGAGKTGTLHVEIPYDFYLGTYEVTQEEWQNLMGKNPSCFSRDGRDKEAVKNVREADLKRFPVENISWYEAQEFIKLVNEKSRETGWEYRMPTELEWEYACRGGPMRDQSESEFDYYFDEATNQVAPAQANVSSNVNRTSKVGSYNANRLGLFDMHGNVFEYCANVRNEHSPRRTRGGSWRQEFLNVRAGAHGERMAAWQGEESGLRVARVPVKTNPAVSAEATVLNYAEIHEADEKMFDDWMTKMKGEAYRPVSLTIKTMKEAPRYTAVAVKEEKKNTWDFSRIDIDQEKYREHVKAMESKNYVAVISNVYRDKSQPKIAFLWHWNAPFRNEGTWTGNKDFIQKKISEKGNTRAAYRSADVIDDIPYFGVLLRADDGIPRIELINQTLHECKAWMEKYKPEAWHPGQIYAYGAGAKTLFGMLPVQDTKGPDWEISWSLSPAQYEAELIARRKDGFRPHNPVVYEDDAGATRFTVIWIRYRLPGSNSLSPETPGWLQLFNGKDLTGWKTHPELPGKWSVNDGILTGKDAVSLLFSDKDHYGDFHLRAEVRVNNGGDSGVFFRIPFSGTTLKDGYEVQISGHAASPVQTGSLFMFSNTKRKTKNAAIFPELSTTDQWVLLEVIATGNKVVTKVNGKTTVDYVEKSERARSGHIALQQGDAQTIVDFKRVEIKELSALEPGWVSLFNGNDLTGWTPGAAADAWKIDGGTLQGAGKIGRLVSAKSDYADFHLRMEVNTSNDALLTLGLRGDANKPALNLSLGRANRQPGKYAPGEILQPADKGAYFFDAAPNLAQPDQWFPLEVIARGPQVTVKIHDKVAVMMTDKLRMSTAGPIALIQHAGSGPFQVRNLVIKELPPSEESGWLRLFNGKDLTGWKTVREPKAKWSVNDGVLIGLGGPDVLVHERADFKNFHLRARTKVNLVGGGYLAFRATPPGLNETVFADGYGAVIDTRSRRPIRTGSLVTIPQLGPVKDFHNTDIPADTWFDLDVIAEGERLQLMVNGVKLVDRDDRSKTRIQGHIGIALYIDNTELQFQKIEIKELPPTPAGAGQLWNGKDLSNWNTFNAKSTAWKIGDGVLEAGGQDSKLVSKRQDLGDFHLRLEMMADADSRAHLVLRSNADATQGYQMELGIARTQRTPGSILREPPLRSRSAADGLVEPNEWFTMEVIAKGNHFTVKHDGKVALEWTDDKWVEERGAIALVQAAGCKGLKIRKLEILPLPAPI